MSSTDELFNAAKNNLNKIAIEISEKPEPTSINTGISNKMESIDNKLSVNSQHEAKILNFLIEKIEKLEKNQIEINNILK